MYVGTYSFIGLALAVFLWLFGGLKMEGSLESWLPFILIFRLVFRFISLLDPILGFVIFYNAPLFSISRGSFSQRIILMGAFEVYLMVPQERLLPASSSP